MSDVAFDKLKDEVQWKEMYHRDLAVSRLVSVHGLRTPQGTPIYRFPSDQFIQVDEFTETMERIRCILEQRLNIRLNHGKIQLYKDGKSHIGEHSDKTLDIEKGSLIVNISFGATRTFVLKKKEKEEDGTRKKHCITLPHNSLIVFGFDTNMKWKHSVQCDHSVKDERISIVFRNIATFMGEDHTLVGQGEKKENNTFLNMEEEQRYLLKCFGKENNESDFDWDQTYGCGFDVYDFSKIQK